jgi:hypothetical protein
MGSRGESNIVKKIPVTSDFGSYVVDSWIDPNDFLECSKQTLKTLEFQIKDVKGNDIPLHGVNVCFSLAFTYKGENSYKFRQIFYLSNRIYRECLGKAR